VDLLEDFIPVAEFEDCGSCQWLCDEFAISAQTITMSLVQTVPVVPTSWTAVKRRYR